MGIDHGTLIMWLAYSPHLLYFNLSYIIKFMVEETMKKLLEAAQAYYNGEPYTMDDKEYDQLLNDAKNENPNFDIFKAIGYIGKPGDSGDDVAHTIKFPAFGKERIKVDQTPAQYVRYGEYAKYFDEQFAKGAKLFYKYDGCSLILYYNPLTGELEDIITRSNEEVGKRRYSNFVRLVPKTIPAGIRAVLCEVMVPLKYGFNYTSRNKANGLTSSKYKTNEINQFCVVVGCDVVVGLNEDGSPMIPCSNYPDRYKLLKSLPNKSMDNRITFYTANPIDIDNMDSYRIEETVTCGNIVETMNMCVDGIVLYMDDYIEAYKAYYTDSKITVIDDIEWNPSNLEQLVPNVKIEPIDLEGTPITHCATNGVSNYLSLHIGKGTRVKVAKVGMVSPQIISVIDGQQPSLLPSCECGHLFTEDDIMVQGLFCPNPDCISKINNRRDWFKDCTKESVYNGIWGRPSEWLVKPINIHGFSVGRVNWTDEMINICLTAIEWCDVDTYIKIITKLYDFTELQMRYVKANTKALMIVLNEYLNGK